MKETKGVGLRLPDDILMAIDALAKQQFDSNRSNAIRHLLMLGLDRQSVDDELNSVKALLERNVMALEAIHMVSYVTAMLATDNDHGRTVADSDITPETVARVNTYRAKAENRLKQLLIEKHGAFGGE